MDAIGLPLLAVLGLVLLLLVVGGAVAVLYNALVSQRVQTESAWSQINVQLQRCHDLIPNLVETVKGYAGHEKDTLERLVQARTAALAARTPAEQVHAENQLTGALGRLFAVAEAYPDLKANQNFLALQGELAGTENQISSARQSYNDAVSRYNSALQRFPSNVVGNVFGIRPVEFFQLDPGQAAAVRQVPQVKF
jgi:LemA protein